MKVTKIAGYVAGAIIMATPAIASAEINLGDNFNQSYTVHDQLSEHMLAGDIKDSINIAKADAALTADNTIKTANFIHPHSGFGFSYFGGSPFFGGGFGHSGFSGFNVGFSSGGFFGGSQFIGNRGFVGSRGFGSRRFVGSRGFSNRGFSRRGFSNRGFSSRGFRSSGFRR